MKLIQLSILCLLCSFSVVGQQKSMNKDIATASVKSNQEEAGVRSTINKYFEGWISNDTMLVGEAMHATCNLKVIKEDKVVAYDRAKYLSFFKPGPAKEGCSGRIISIDITGPIAAAKCELETPSKIYTDYFNMIKVDSKWVIVDKISTNVKK